MKILMIAQEPELVPDKVATGNAIRAQQLTRVITGSGHELIHIWLDKSGTDGENCFSDRDELRSLLLRHRPDVYLVNYWELLDLMPFESSVPLVLDFIAPRPLEALYQTPGQLQHDLHRLEVNLSKVDLVLVGNKSQEGLILIPLLNSLMDLRTETGVAIVPLAADIAGKPRSMPETDGWKLVSGGVNWPWRNSQPYIEVLENMGENAPGLIRLGGEYSLGNSPEEKHPKTTGRAPLIPYREFSELLLNEAHIGIELAEENFERRYSQSFRSLEFLRHGLPVICNRYLPIARQIERYDAGWLVDQPGELAELLPQIMQDPEIWRQKSANAHRLVSECLNPEIAGTALLKWLESPHKASRLEREEPIIPLLKEPPANVRVRHVVDLLSTAIKNRIFEFQKVLFGGHKDNGIVFVTRGDLFPADHGAAVKIIETARGLSKHGRPVALVTDDRRYWWRIDNGDIKRHRIPFWLRLANKPSAWIKMMHYTTDIPQSNAFLYLPMTDGSFFWRTIYAGRKVGASIIQAEFPAYVRPSIPASHVLDARVVMVEHNVEYERIRAQVPELTEEQYQRYKAVEIDLANKSDAVICVSDNDRQKLAVDGVVLRRLHTIPHGVDLEQFELPTQADARQRYDIPQDATVLVYHGTFAYEPNLEALNVFADELLPRLDQLGLTCHVLAVGRQPPDASPHPRIHLTGSVESVAPWLKAADIAVVPLLEGGGTRMKIVDCFAAGLPLISTAKGIEGIPVENGREALIIDDWDEMAAAIKQLVDSPEYAKQISDRGYALAQKLDWKSIAAEYIKVYDSF